MAILKKSDLKYTYTWTVLGDDNPKITGKPDSTLLNRHEGYEVLYFINRIADNSKWETIVPCLKAERLIRDHLPSDVRSHANVLKWLIDNWESY
jgi:hypothetical protein